MMVMSAVWVGVRGGAARCKGVRGMVLELGRLSHSDGDGDGR